MSVILPQEAPGLQSRKEKENPGIDRSGKCRALQPVIDGNRGCEKR
jgi:hypothetical protein